MLAAAALAGTAAAEPPPQPAAAVRTADAVCASAARPDLARRLGADIRDALEGRAGVASVAVRDRVHGVRCAVDAGRRYDAASTVKVTILAALLRRAREDGRRLTAAERALATTMITRSDNGAASALWRRVGRARFARFLTLAGMARTVPGPGRYWGLTQITARDEDRLLALLTRRNAVLAAADRAYVLGLMHRVVPAQRWGTPAGRPAGAGWHVKNGWLPRHGRVWRVHSLGAFDGRDRDYTIVVLTRDTPSMAYGVATIERVARAVHRDLNPGLRAADPAGERAPGAAETSDGSVPPDA
ncbi:class A beta-lactamase-related serine hydrolase [Actinomadura sp. PM05-2]|uniref:Class A beta-lactamase-related serine hydrolase n=1 Tax=Actinomadura parmotrematis TaxID=2864039 RepID=A0ABS7FR31_9ACTN|nr:class A beta-lactamase-related serine hydrolase [Actinomadura parmotrematis]